MRTGLLLVAGLAIACSGRSSSNTEPEVVLADQQPVKDGVRSTYSIELGALAPEARRGALDQAVRTMRLRLQGAKIAGHVAVDKDTLVVDIASFEAEVVARVGDLLGPTGHVVVQVAQPGAAFMTELAAHAAQDSEAARERITTDKDEWETPDGKRFSDWWLKAEDRQQAVTVERAKELGCLRGPPGNRDSVMCRVTGCAAIQTYVAALAAREPRFAIPADRALVCDRFRQEPDMPPPAWHTYYVERAPAIDVTVRRTTIGRDPDNHPRIQLELDGAGTKALAVTTKQHVGARLVIVIDGRVAAAPIIDGEIDNGRLSFSVADARSDEENADHARDLAIVLASGALPGHVVLETRARLADGVPRFDQ